MSERSASTFRRATATEAEQRMMALLSAAKITYVWQWQIPRWGEFTKDGKIKSYVADFAVGNGWDWSIFVEVDGDAHNGEEEYDATRDRYLEHLGYRVMRFTNRMVLHSGKEVIAAIQTEFRRVKA